MVEAIALLLQQQGTRVAVLSRGYGGMRREAITVVSDGMRCLVPPDVVGDEAVLLAGRLTGIPVLVAQDRFAAGKLAVERFHVEAIVLDDGFQHVQLARDLNILLLDATRPFGTERVFPRGDLRERPTALARADVIVLTRWELNMPAALSNLPCLLPPVFRSRHEPYAARLLHSGGEQSLSALNGRRLVAFCGIGMPKDFHQMLRQLGAEVAAFRPFPDHHPYTRRELEDLSILARQLGAAGLVTTEKDAVRLQGLPPCEWPVWIVHIQCRIVDRKAAWDACILGVTGRCRPDPPALGNDNS
jgi:tetraacyldisaccharide 4'-kinase